MSLTFQPSSGVMSGDYGATKFDINALSPALNSVREKVVRDPRTLGSLVKYAEHAYKIEAGKGLPGYYTLYNSAKSAKSPLAAQAVFTGLYAAAQSSAPLTAKAIKDAATAWRDGGSTFPGGTSKVKEGLADRLPELPGSDGEKFYEQSWFIPAIAAGTVLLLGMMVIAAKD
jgi:hypothetical protein